MKRRLVGAVVLVSLTVIFLPMLLEDPKDYRVSLGHSNVPPLPSEKPPFKSLALPASDDEPLIPPLPPHTENQAAAPPIAARTPPSPRPIPSPPLPSPEADISAWVVQIASLGSREKAKQLVDEIRNQGFSAFLEPVQAEGRELLRVRVGPELDRARAERMVIDIEKKINLKGQVMRYP